MLAGTGLMAGGLALRLGVVAVPGVGPDASPGPVAIVTVSPPATSIPAPDPVSTAVPTPASTSEPTSAATPASTPAPTVTPAITDPPGATWFADEFEAVAAWPTGDLDWLTATVEGGRYRVDAQETDLPVIVLASAGEGSPGADLVVSAVLEIGAHTNAVTSAGIALEALDGSRLLVMLGADGRVSVYRDSIEVFDGLASGTTDPPAGLVELRVTVADGVVTATVDGRPVVSAQASVEPAGVGLAFWAVGGDATVSLDRYEVRSLP
jgi:hypothetical protein